VSSLLTGDYGIRHKEGFEVIGRILDSELRGCSLQVRRFGKEEKENTNFEFPSPQKNFPVSSEETVEALSNLTNIWLTKSHPKRKKIVQEIAQAGIFSHGSIEAGLDRTFQVLTSFETKKRVDPSHLHVEISAGNLPVTGVFGFYRSLLTGSASIHRISSRGGNLLQYLWEDLKEIHPQLSKRIVIVQTDSENEEQTRKLLSEASSLSIQGDDETIERILNLAPPNVPIEKAGDRYSAIWIQDPKSLTDEMYGKMAEDFFIWEQLGCRSPQIVYVENDFQDFVDLLCSALDTLGDRWGRKPNPRSFGAMKWVLDQMKLKGEKIPFTFPSTQVMAIQTDRLIPSLFSLPGIFQITNQVNFILPKLLAVASQFPLNLPNVERVELGMLQSPKFIL
jgi:hypothetical protein